MYATDDLVREGIFYEKDYSNERPKYLITRDYKKVDLKETSSRRKAFLI